MAYEKFYEARDKITSLLEEDLIGPVDQKEVLHENPERYYLMAKLYPQTSNSINTSANNPMQGNKNEEEISLNNSDTLFTQADDAEENPLSQSNAIRQRSAGITFTVKSGISAFNCKVSWAWYYKIDPADTDKNTNWQRAPQKWEMKVPVPYQNNFGSEYFPLKDEVYLHMHWLRNEAQSKDTIITLTLVNKNIIEETDSRDFRDKCIEKTMFQVNLSVEGEPGTFVKAPEYGNISNDEETLEMQLLYHNYQCFGQGHGCSVEWDMSHDNQPCWIRMSFLPKYSLYQMRPVIFEDNKSFNMKFLMEANASEVIGELNRFLQQYHNWIEKNAAKVSSLEQKLMPTAQKNIQKCLTALTRMKNTVEMLRDSANTTGLGHAPWRAFQLANRAMFMQRKQSYYKLHKQEVADEKINWYPFQLAFILHEIGGIINPKDKTRDTVDLLWFPTGGGKTEAYLGIAAFTIFLRRLKNSQDRTTAVMMRYTLRLLTLQQFERASMLIMACNEINLDEQISTGEIGIGLWVGNGLTPNKLSEAKDYLQKSLEDPQFSLRNTKGTPCLLKFCPWCGSRLYEKDYVINENTRRMEIHCRNKDCMSNYFNDGTLPIHLIDDDIYANKPTFIVSTVDKFAQLPKNEQAAALFDREHEAPNNPPELIIQDEMHLISGPLGSMVGLYETAINHLCTTEDGIGPKIIASTATASNASFQIKQLYGRPFSQFPQQCLTTDDSFFAVKSNKFEKPTRLYCGIMSSSATFTTTLIRTQAALFFATRSLLYHDQINSSVVDNYWTIICYFNSIRELGNSLTQLEDDTRFRYEYLRDSKFKNVKEMNKIKYPSNFMELTSRKTSDEVAKILSQLAYSITDNKDVGNVLDCVSSTNMISVGVDVSRLGNMIVAGQPKTNSEYIQATSRVGRQNPGLVITLYNANRSRDRSHYEQFLKYHSGMYRYVEATSLTPFSDQAVIKGIHAVFVTLCRYLDINLQANESASAFNPDLPVVKKARDIILNRVKAIDPHAVSLVDERLQDFIQYWSLIKETCAYTRRSAKDRYYLLKNDTSDEEYSTMNSMRTVDDTSSVFIYNN